MNTLQSRIEEISKNIRSTTIYDPCFFEQWNLRAKLIRTLRENGHQYP